MPNVSHIRTVMSFYSSDGTAAGYAASLLIELAALQAGYFAAVVVTVLRRRMQLARRDDQ
jgi:hypothetical protein